MGNTSLKVPREIALMVAILYGLTITLVIRLIVPGAFGDEHRLLTVLSGFVSMPKDILAACMSFVVIFLSVVLAGLLKLFYSAKSYSIFQFYIDYFKGAADTRGAEYRLIFPLIVLLGIIFSAGSYPEVVWWLLVLIYLSFELFNDWTKELGAKSKSKSVKQ